MPSRARASFCPAEFDVAVLYLQGCAASSIQPLRNGARRAVYALASFDIGACTPDAVRVNEFIHNASRNMTYTPNEFFDAFPQHIDQDPPSALFLPMPLYRFLAAVNKQDFQLAVDSIICDIAPDAFQHPSPPTRHTIALDNVLCTLVDSQRANASRFWTIPITAVAPHPIPAHQLNNPDSDPSQSSSFALAQTLYYL